MKVPKPSPPNTSSGLVYHHPQSRQYEEASKSRCCMPTDEECLLWHSYWLTRHRGIIEVITWLKELPMAAQERALGQLEALYDDAVFGRLSAKDPGEPIKAIHQGNDFYELRLAFNDFGRSEKLFRQYHAEPSRVGLENLLVTSHAHFKQVSGLKQDEISLQQTEHMRQAVHRYSSGKPSLWHLATNGTEPIHPLDLIEDLLED